jgi:predicted transcriptional regulator
MPLLKSIPEIYEDGFQELAILSEANFTKIKNYLSNAPLVSSIENLVNSISSSKGLELLEIEDIFESVGSLVGFIEKKEIIEEVIQDVVMLSMVQELVTPKNKKRFEKRLTFLINNEQIYYAAKAGSLASNYGNVFIESRTISDIRPVFDTEVENQLKAGIVIHNLTIHYQSSEAPFHKDITLALTLKDIKSLKEVLDRAEKKEKRLQVVFEKTNIKNLNENRN